MSEGLSQGPYVVTRVEFEPVTFHTEGTKHHHWATMPLVQFLSFLFIVYYKIYRSPRLIQAQRFMITMRSYASFNAIEIWTSEGV